MAPARDKNEPAAAAASLAGTPEFRSVRQRYEHLTGSEALRLDALQLRVAEKLDRLISELRAKRLAAKSSALGWLFGKRRETRDPVRGLYIHGGVGRGKTMLMDMFFELVPVRRKRRVHFNDFMADVHDRIQRQREALNRGETKEKDPIPPIARTLADEAWVLCFDEFAVSDIADAMILSRLFSALFQHGVVVVATSNVAPDDLYKDGLNRGLFEPFIGILKRHCDVFALDGDTDYRQLKLSELPVYVTPLGEEARQSMDAAWQTAVSGHDEGPRTIAVKGRQVRIPQANGKAARFTFDDLCAQPLAARDYLAIAEAFDTVFIDDIPVLRPDQRNEAKRLILLIDTLYDKHIRLFASAAAEPAGLYPEGTGRERFEFERTASRLAEMRSSEWGRPD
ncbi:cell division protein ZapE [Chelativorans sp. ZYF759]|uniref:cell division protein ZapE n=1 Tax=Chelativorans sp. ZYF759 TaxID=2692213 RepID=UPI00145D1735|nr:cell division protein ZapE [Chelativorans sp. ZYF759]